MRLRWFLGVLSLTGLSFADEAAAPTAPAKPPAAPAAAPAGGVPQDPAGIKGISPFWESVRIGDSALLARDFENAIGQYRDAITKDPQNPVGHLRLAEAQFGKGELKEAEQSLEAASRFADKQPTLKAKALFMMALLREQQRDFERATQAWKTYQEFGRGQPKAQLHQRTPPERMKRIQVAKQLAVDYAAVKERIAKRLEEADESVRKSAQ